MFVISQSFTRENTYIILKQEGTISMYNLTVTLEW